MKNRPLPRHCDTFLRIAKAAKLSHPLGRALYACNRLQNGSFKFSVLLCATIHPDAPGIHDSPDEDITKLLEKIRPSTAQRWLKHWKSGGSIKSLSHGSAGRIR